MTGKERLIHILLLLRQHSDIEHQLSTADIVSHFQELGVPTDRKTINADIAMMIKCGINIVENKGTQNPMSLS